MQMVATTDCTCALQHWAYCPLHAMWTTFRNRFDICLWSCKYLQLQSHNSTCFHLETASLWAAWTPANAAAFLTNLETGTSNAKTGGTASWQQQSGELGTSKSDRFPRRGIKEREIWCRRLVWDLTMLDSSDVYYYVITTLALWQWPSWIAWLHPADCSMCHGFVSCEDFALCWINSMSLSI